MDSGKRLFKAFLGKMPQSQPQPSQENGQPSAPPSPAVAWGQPGAPSSSQQVLQTQDWEDSEPLRHQGSPSPCFKRELTAKGTRHSGKISVMKESKTPGKKGVRRSTVPGRAQQSWRCVTIREVTCAILETLAHAAEQEGRRTRATAEEVMPASRETRDCAPPAQESGLNPPTAGGLGRGCRQLLGNQTGQQPEGHDLRGVRDAGEQAPSRRWNVSIDERWRLAVLGGGERPGLAGATLSYRDLAQIVAQLVSQDEDKGVLLPHPPRSAESSSAFQAFLVRSAPFWHNVTLEAQASRSPPS
ncbi:testis-expressed protein 22 [Sagmatias obliquidens]|uniref:testis-expressed protein 22 n=1 Tax=Sagmatias obliquidens TaxID=3371155 RepID=UPI000F442411|nr:testis-expressed protein 22 [Lagenorhynchus obliquidens]